MSHVTRLVKLLLSKWRPLIFKGPVWLIKSHDSLTNHGRFDKVWDCGRFWIHELGPYLLPRELVLRHQAPTSTVRLLKLTSSKLGPNSRMLTWSAHISKSTQQQTCVDFSLETTQHATGLSNQEQVLSQSSESLYSSKVSTPEDNFRVWTHKETS